MEDEQRDIPAYGNLAFAPQVTPEFLFQKSREYAPQEGLDNLATALDEYAHTMAEIRGLPCTVKVEEKPAAHDDPVKRLLRDLGIDFPSQDSSAE